MVDALDALAIENASLKEANGHLHQQTNKLGEEILKLRAEVAAKEKFVKDAIAACSNAGRLRELLREAEKKMRDWHTEDREQAGGGGMCEFQFCRSCGNRDFEPHKYDCRFVELVTRIDAALEEGK